MVVIIYHLQGGGCHRLVELCLHEVLRIAEAQLVNRHILIMGTGHLLRVLLQLLVHYAVSKCRE